MVAMSPLGLLCNKPPWGAMVAVDLKAGKILWRSSVGTTEDRAPLGIAFNWGTPLVNGVVITAGGLVFTGAMDAYLRAFDAKSGEELWQGRLPVPGVANPMTYLWKGEQYVAIAAGGHSEAGATIGDSVVAFRLAAAGRGALAVVAHHRPSRGTVLEQGDRVCACACADGGRGVALAAARHAAQDRHLALGDAGEPSALYGFTNNFAAYDVKKTVLALGPSLRSCSRSFATAARARWPRPWSASSPPSPPSASGRAPPTSSASP